MTRRKLHVNMTFAMFIVPAPAAAGCARGARAARPAWSASFRGQGRGGGAQVGTLARAGESREANCARRRAAVHCKNRAAVHCRKHRAAVNCGKR